MKDARAEIRRVVWPKRPETVQTTGIVLMLVVVFGLILIMSDQNKTLPVGLASMLGSNDLRWGDIMAGATLIAIPLLILFTFLYRYFVAGLAAGALKA